MEERTTLGPMNERQCKANAANVTDILEAEATYINRFLSLPTLSFGEPTICRGYL